MLVDADHHGVAGAEFDQVGVVALREHIVAEGGLEHLRIRGNARATRTRKERGRLNLQAQLLRGRLQRRRVLVGLVSELSSQVVVSAILRTGFGFLEKLVAHLIERLGDPAAHIAQPDDVVALVRQHRLRDLPLLHLEHGLVERRGGHTLLQPAEIATLTLRAEVVGILLCELGEIGGRRLRSNLLRFGQSGLLLFRRGVLGHIDQDVRNQALLGLHELRLLVLVALAQLLVRRRSSGLHVSLVDLDVLQRDLLGSDELVLALVVVGLHLLTGHRRVVDLGLRQLHVADVTTLKTQVDETVNIGASYDRACGDRIRNQRRLQRGQHFVLEHVRGLALHREHSPISGGIELPVQLEGRDPCYEIAQRLAGYDHTEIAVCLLQQLLINELVENRKLGCRLVKDTSVEAVSLLLAGALTQLVEAILELLLADFLLAYLRDKGVVARHEVGLDAEEGHGKDSNAQNDDGRPSVHLVTQSLQHGDVPEIVFGAHSAVLK